MRTTIFLGAGASAAEGAPLQDALFREYFESVRGQTPADEMDRELVTYFHDIFGLDCDHGDLATMKFPTFEEALGIADLALSRNESLREFHNINRATNSNRLGFIRQYLVFLLARVIDHKLTASHGIHRQLVDNLRRSRLLDSTSFISTNYDILIDNALVDLYTDFSLDYGVEFTNFEKAGDWRRPHDPAIHLLKIHGSLNWLFCPTCNALTLTPKDKGVIHLITDLTQAYCQSCETVYSPIIVPPTFYKDMSNVFLQIVWNRAEKILRESDHIVFCGYSFPDADMHIKYLLKRAQTNRRSPLRITVINHRDGKKNSQARLEQDRFIRFLGPVNFTRASFEDFSRAPASFLEVRPAKVRRSIRVNGAPNNAH